MEKQVLIFGKQGVSMQHQQYQNRTIIVVSEKTCVEENNWTQVVASPQTLVLLLHGGAQHKHVVVW